MRATEPLPRFACPDWWDRLQAGETPMAPVPLNERKAAKALAFFNRLRLPDIPGNPAMSDACGDWFKEILVAFFASEDPETHQQIVWELLCEVPKKNSKSTYVAALGLTALYLEEAPNRQMLLVGPSQNISERCFDQAQGMIRLDETLRALFHVQDHKKTIIRRKTGTELSVKTFDTGIVTGEIPVLTIIDELHELGKKSKAAAVMQQIRGGGITKQRGKLCMITTQSDEAPAGVWKTELDKARSIRDGKSGPSPIMLPVLYEFPAELQAQQDWWKNPENWHFVLPNLGLSIDEQALIDDFKNNGSVSAETLQIWASQHLNIEIGVGLHAERWPGALFWEDAAQPGLTLDEILSVSDVVTMGIDGGGLDDLMSLAVIGRHAETREWLTWSRAWCDPLVFERRKQIAPTLRGFEADGDLVVCREVGQDAVEMAEIILRIADAGLLPEKEAIGVDNWSGAMAVLETLLAEGVSEEWLLSVGQGFKQQPAVHMLPRKLKDKTCRHADQPMMAWVVGNAKSELRGSNYVVTKKAAGSAKIDPLMALFNAAMLMMGNPMASGGSTPWDADPEYRMPI